MDYNFNIAGLPVRMDFDPGPAFENFRADSANDKEKMYHPLVFSVGDEFRDCPPLFSVEQEQFNVHSYHDGFVYESTQEHGARVYCNTGYTKCIVAGAGGPGLEHLIRLVIESRLIHEGKISLHSSCIGTPGGAFCLTGVSGVGKSTRAAAFCDMPGFELISGDRPCIDCISHDAYGVPWDGKEGLHINKCVPLRAVFCVRRLDQAGDPCTRPGESLRLLSEKTAYQKLIAQTFLPMWDTDTAAMAMGNLKKLISNVNVYELTSGPDLKSAKKSWEIIRKEVFDED